MTQTDYIYEAIESTDVWVYMLYWGLEAEYFIRIMN